MFILEKYDTLDVVDVGSSYYADVIFKNDFLDTFQQLLDECKEKIIVFGNKMNSDEFIELIKNAQSKHFSATSGCDLFWNPDKGFFEIYVYKEANYVCTEDLDTAVLRVEINLLDKTKPYMYIIDCK